MRGETPSLYYNIPESQHGKNYEIPGTPSGQLPSIKPEEIGYFGALLQEVDEANLTIDQQKERKIMMLLLKIKNGSPPLRKSALR